ncbi:hypothetical protein SAMN04489730_3872 [Amycolatopsis australiensis]|uniref:Uncharacterized protein n=1 Tax=Amycolatopsis australiensis TaxID=546364 RepID=A0A1K1RSG9_9PSEU|nr:hypothetical protein SAMN04489730_3872 [Amycolatopsis australiensis]
MTSLWCASYHGPTVPGVTPRHRKAVILAMWGLACYVALRARSKTRLSTPARARHACLRIHRNVVRKPSDPAPQARVGLIFLGVCLVVVSAVLGYASWILYLDGRPAVIASAGHHLGIGLEVYTPTNVSVDLYVVFSPGVVGGTGVVVIPRFRTQRQSPFVVGIEFTGDARLRSDGLTAGSRPIYIPQKDVGLPFVTRRQIFVSTVDPKQLNESGYGNAGISGETFGSYVQRSGFRVSAHLPAINSPISCNRLDQVDAEMLQTAAVSEEDWDELIGPCDADSGERGMIEIELRYLILDPRIDSASPSPVITQNGGLSWLAGVSDVLIEAQANFTSISLEAEAQRKLFLAGVGLGGSIALLPIGVQAGWAGRRSKPRS